MNFPNFVNILDDSFVVNLLDIILAMIYSDSLLYVSGFEVKVVSSDNYVKRDSGLIYRDFEVGKGDCPKDGQQVFL